MQYGRIVLYALVIVVAAASGYFILTSILSESFEQCRPFPKSNCNEIARYTLEQYPGAISSIERTELMLNRDGVFKPEETKVDSWLFTIYLENPILLNDVETSRIGVYVNTENVSQMWVGIR